MQTVYIKEVNARLQYARFLEGKGKIVILGTGGPRCRFLKTNMYPCKLPARCNTTNPEEVGEKCRR